MDTAPVKLTSARAWRTYIGGSQIDANHGIEGSQDTQFPEEWIMSIVSARNAGREPIKAEGMSYLEGRSVSLKDYITDDPAATLGADHAQKLGATTGVLVKIIDAGERLTIQAHPSKVKAPILFNSPFGKTECWHILGGREINGEKPCIYMGFKEGITRERWKEIFDTQDIPAMLDALHKFPVQPGETYLICGGVPHAIGAGCLLVEIQEPTDYTVRTERITPAGLHIADFQCHQGLGFDKMFDVFEYDELTYEDAYKQWCIPPVTLEETEDYIRREVIGYAQTSCFRMERYDISGSCVFPESDRFCGLYILSGKGTLTDTDGDHAVSGGDQFFVPATSKAFTVTATDAPITLFRCFGPEL